MSARLEAILDRDVCEVFTDEEVDLLREAKPAHLAASFAV